MNQRTHDGKSPLTIPRPAWFAALSLASVVPAVFIFMAMDGGPGPLSEAEMTRIGVYASTVKDEGMPGPLTVPVNDQVSLSLEHSIERPISTVTIRTRNLQVCTELASAVFTLPRESFSGSPFRSMTINSHRITRSDALNFVTMQAQCTMALDQGAEVDLAFLYNNA